SNGSTNVRFNILRREVTSVSLIVSSISVTTLTPLRFAKNTGTEPSENTSGGGGFVGLLKGASSGSPDVRYWASKLAGISNLQLNSPLRFDFVWRTSC